MTQHSRQQRGHCPVCKRSVTLTADGKISRHNGTIQAYAPPEVCPGVDGERKPQVMSDDEAVPALLIASHPNLPR